MRFSPDGRTVVAVELWTLYLWDVATGKQIFTSPLKGDYEFSSDGKRIACKVDDEIRVLDATNGSLLRTYPIKKITGPHYFRLFEFNDDFLAIAVPDDSGRPLRLTLWTLEQHFSEEITFNGSTAPSIVAVSPDRSLIALGYGQTQLNDTGIDSRKYAVAIYRLADGVLVRSLAGNAAGTMSLGFSPDSKFLATGGSFGDGRMRLWRVADGELMAEVSVRDPSRMERLLSQLEQVRAIAFSKDGQQLAFGGSDQLIYVVNIANGKLLKSLAGHRKRS